MEIEMVDHSGHCMVQTADYRGTEAQRQPVMSYLTRLSANES